MFNSVREAVRRPLISRVSLSLQSRSFADTSVFAQQAAASLVRVRSQAPLVQCITNYVSMDIMANVLIASGMSPAMAHGGKCGEAKEFANIASAVNINLGTLDEDWALGAMDAAKVCKGMAKPWVVDPVGFLALTYRTGIITDLIHMGPTVLKGNASEMVACAQFAYPDLKEIPATASNEETKAKGVDSAISTDSVNVVLLDEFAKKMGGVICMTGKHDYVTDGTIRFWVTHEVPALADFTASGCSLGAVIAGFCAVLPELGSATATAHAVAYYTIAGEMAAEDSTYSRGPGSFRTGFLDMLRAVKEEDVASRGRLSLLN